MPGAENSCKQIRLDWIDLAFPEIIPETRSLKNIKQQQGKGKRETGQERRIREEMFLYNLHLQKTGNTPTFFLVTNYSVTQVI